MGQVLLYHLKIKTKYCYKSHLLCLISSDFANLLNEQAIQGSGVNKFTDHEHNSDSVWQAMANTPPSSSSTLVSFRKGLPSLSKNW